MSNRAAPTATFALSMSFVRQLDLLPREFHEEVETSRVRGLWTLVLTLLLTGLGNLILTDWLRAESSRRYVTLIHEKVAPVIKLRDLALQQTTVNENLERWLGHVESARPDDSLLQALAAVTTAIRPYNHDVLIDSIEIHLPTETSMIEPTAQNPEPQRPHTVGNVTIDARVSHPETAQQLLQSLSEQDRLSEISIQANESRDDRLQIQLRAIPHATRIQP